MANITLRPYQEDLIRSVRLSVAKGHRAVCAVLGCGGGKSVIAATIAKSATDRHNRVLFLVHRKELCDQIRGTFTRCGVDMGLCDVCMVQTATRRLDQMPEYQVIITDECQHCTAKSYTNIYDHYPEAVNLGFTATPIRLNRGGLGDVYQELIPSVSTRWLIENHYLAPYRYYSAPLADTQQLHIHGGDFRQDEVAALMEDHAIYGDTVRQWERLAKGKKTIVYCASVEASKKTAEEFTQAGYNATSVDGCMDKHSRDFVMGSFREGYVQILCNCELFGEGLDVPDCECVVLLRPTQSLTLYIQQSMRSMRYLPGKVAIIIDHVGNCYRHGLPDDAREWSLEPKKVQENTVKIRECPVCFAVYSPTLDRCPYCGFRAQKEIRTQGTKTVEVDLVEVQRQEDIRNTRLQDAELETWEQVTEFQKLHKYKFGWCIRYAADHGIQIPAKYSYMRRIIGV